MKYTNKIFCRCCKSSKITKYLDLGNQPLANSYHKGKSKSGVPLVVMICKNCFHNQLSVVVDPDIMFRDYLYVSGTTKTLQYHMDKLAQEAVSRFAKKKLKVLDIACNDATQLEFFRKLGCEVMGVDPALNLKPLSAKKKIPVVVDYWIPSVAKKIGKKFDIIMGANVFAHVDNHDEFLEACKIALNLDGILILEFPYADNMITHFEFDTVYHEHLSYFLVNSFKTLAERTGFQIIDVIRTPIHGGSIRFFLKTGSGKHSRKISDLIESERKKGLLNIETYKKYAMQVRENKRKMKELLKKLRKQGKKIVGYGASAKGNTMLNYFKIKLSYIVDDNNLKWGFKTPGQDIPIMAPESLRTESKEIYIVILSWNFYNEIASKILKIRGKMHDRAILYVPKVLIRLIESKKKYMQSA